MSESFSCEGCVLPVTMSDHGGPILCHFLISCGLMVLAQDRSLCIASGGPTFSMPAGTEKVAAVGKPDSIIFCHWPFGNASNVSISQSSSDTSESSGEAALCQGVPGNKNCGAQVVNGDRAVECNKCHYWFHTKCQAIHDALFRFKCLSWLCEKCKKTLNDGKDLQILAKGDQSRLVSLEAKVREMGEEVRNHMKIIVQSVK